MTKQGQHWGKTQKYFSTDFSKRSTPFSLCCATLAVAFSARPEKFSGKNSFKKYLAVCWDYGANRKSHFKQFWSLEIFQHFSFWPIFGHFPLILNITFPLKGPGVSPQDSRWHPWPTLGPNSKFLSTDFSKCVTHFCLFSTTVVLAHTGAVISARHKKCPVVERAEINFNLQ